MAEETYFPEDDSSRKWDDDVFKKWFKSGGKSGFLALGTWLEAGKAYVDIGETTSDGAKATKVFANVIELATYLRAVYDGKAGNLYYKRGELPTAESFISYGGGKISGKPVSRVLKVHHWQTKYGDSPEFDSRSFAWKCGHFAAKQTDSGAFIPDKTKPISTNMIKVSRVEMAEMSYRLDLVLTWFANREEELFTALNGNKR